MCLAPQRRAHFRHLNFQKWSEPLVFYILTSKCASCHNGVHFFHIATLKSAPNPSCFLHFDFEMCFAPHGVHFFDISTSKSAPKLKCLLRATTACTFSTSQLLKVFRTPRVFYILTSKCASRHNSVHFFDISTSKSAPKLKCFVHVDFEMCFAPQRRAIFHLSSGQMAPHPPL